MYTLFQALHTCLAPLAYCQPRFQDHPVLDSLPVLLCTVYADSAYLLPRVQHCSAAAAFAAICMQQSRSPDETRLTSRQRNNADAVVTPVIAFVLLSQR
jgi:hypothetical protein